MSYSLANTKYEIYWGIEKYDQSFRQDKWDPEELGRPNTTKSFDFSTEDNQSWLLEFCDTLESQKFVKAR